MQVSDWLIESLFLISVIIFIITRWIVKNSALKGRKSINLNDMFEQAAAETDISFEVFERVINIIGEVYDVDPEKLRLSDKLKLFYDLDSWELGEGTERLNDWLAEEFSISKFDVEPKSILELVVEVGEQIKNED